MESMERLIAHDFVYSIKRVADKNSSSGYWAFDGLIEGLDEFLIFHQKQ